MTLRKYIRNRPPKAWLGEEPVERGVPWEEVGVDVGVGVGVDAEDVEQVAD